MIHSVMNKLKIILSTLLISCIPFLSSVNALYVFTFSRQKWNEWDVPTNPDDWTWIVGSRSVLDVIKLVNSYLRFGVGFVCFLFMIINGYKLITASWDEKQSKSATTGLLWSFVWIIICLLAYIVVNLTVKLFMK